MSLYEDLGYFIVRGLSLLALLVLLVVVSPVSESLL